MSAKSTVYNKSFFINDMDVFLFKGYNSSNDIHAILVIVIFKNGDRLNIDKMFDTQELRDKAFSSIDFSTIYTMFDELRKGINELP
jgi:hypothetical protein